MTSHSSQLANILPMLCNAVGVVANVGSGILDEGSGVGGIVSEVMWKVTNSQSAQASSFTDGKGLLIFQIESYTKKPFV